MSNFDDLTAMVLIVKLKSKALFVGPYSNSQQRLFERVFLLREENEMNFTQIANHLTKTGTTSPHGCALGAEIDFCMSSRRCVNKQIMCECVRNTQHVD